MKDISEHKWYRTIGIVAFATIFTAACAGTEKKEAASQLAVARTTVADAVGVGAPEFASAELKAAQENLDAAEKAAMADETGKATRLAEKAQLDAQLAIAKTRAGKAQKAVAALEERERALREEMNRTAK